MHAHGVVLTLQPREHSSCSPEVRVRVGVGVGVGVRARHGHRALTRVLHGVHVALKLEQVDLRVGARVEVVRGVPVRPALALHYRSPLEEGE